jgi:hypothetical protein
MNDPKKPTKAAFLKQQDDFYEDHVKFHAADAFCGTAGRAEMRHILELVAKLSDAELRNLVERAGVHVTDNGFDRDTYEGVIDEMGRNEFYELYADIKKA